MTGVRLLTIIAAAFLLSACSGLEYTRLQNVEAPADPFAKALFNEYKALSGYESEEGDHIDSDVFAIRARQTASGTIPAPEEVAGRKHTERSAKALSSARARLVKALDGGARSESPAASARGQAMFDCWSQELEEGHQQDHIDYCRIGLFVELAKIDPVVVQPAPTPEPAPAAKPSPQTFIVYFEFDRADINTAGQAVIASAAAAVKATKPATISVVGHTDRAGPSGYNATLSEARADAVANALVSAGVSGRLLSIGSLGENAPALQTKDGVREPANRRTEITLRY